MIICHVQQILDMIATMVCGFVMDFVQTIRSLAMELAEIIISSVMENVSETIFNAMENADQTNLNVERRITVFIC